MPLKTAFRRLTLLITTTLLTVAASAQGETVSRLANRCWNTNPKIEQSLFEATCSACNTEANEDYSTVCAEEIQTADAAYETWSNDSIVTTYQAWSNALNIRDNCKTRIINTCFDSETASED